MECRRRFKVVWSAIHRELTEADVEGARTDEQTIKDRPWNRLRRDTPS
jgi:siderophore synthetase component